ncbi:HAD family hydrolase [Mongoliitalea daihaiensis]|uniref:HAD family hydrolase n=1 Tax=Mongoliitalea daihaiensis TaxID=2782006 RepID=UPI001F25303B|nr:HAD family phosphatase [Mongoliitalea daihaiensis]UJP64080.1 HAD family phosphatase [Mongoliitalea daihaiensis]
MKNLENIDFLIFDLGNVIIDIDYDFSINELKKNIPTQKFELTSLFFPSKFHKDYEKGLISTDEFRNEIRKHFDLPLSNQQIDHVWNSLLRTIPQSRINILRELRGRFGTAILSNTNSLHIDAFEQMIKEQTNETSIYNLCDHVFLSHQLGLAKPDVAIYETVLEKIKVKPARVLFFDDLESNLNGAEKLGIKTQLITKDYGIEDFFKN